MTGSLGHSQWPLRIIVLLTGVTLGLFVWWTYIGDVARLYPLEFTHGRWLVAADEAPQGYFRQELYIPGAIRQAWLMVAATDSFVLYVNGKAVDGKGYASLNVSGIYDIGAYLSPGKNVIAVAVQRLSYPGPAMAALEGVYRDQMGHEHPFATDATWKASTVEQMQGGSEIPWYGEGFDATSWRTARSTDRPTSSEIYPLNAPPLAFAMPPHGKWIEAAETSPRQVTFAYTFRLPDPIEDAWIRIVASPPYALAINGIPVEAGDPLGDIEGLRLPRFQGVALWRDREGLSTDLYPITPLLRQGSNRITVSPGQRFSSLPGLFVDGFVVSRGEVWPFGSDATWTVTAPSSLPLQTPTPQNALILAHVAPEHDVLPIRQATTTRVSLRYTIQQLLSLASLLVLTAGLSYLSWMTSARLLQALGRGTLPEARSLDALTHLPTLLTLGAFYLASFDVRIDPTFPFQGWVIGLAVALLFVFKAMVFVEAWYHRQQDHHGPSAASPHRLDVTRVGTIMLLLGLIATGAAFRLHNLDAQSLYHDEIHMVTYVQGLLEKGYPHKMIGPIERPLATYELAPYPIALSVLLFGMSDFTLRLPAALFGIMTILLVYFVGSRIFDRRVGLLAAAVYTFCPQALIWAQYLWHPQQTQFLALLTSYLFYQAIRHTPIAPRYLYPAALAFIATYLSWEGSGFFLPAMALGLAAVKGKDLSWLREKHLWMAVGIVSVAIVLQLIRRILLQVPYLVIGQGLSDVSLPAPYFLNPMYDPTFYLKNFLWLENNVILTLLVLGMLPFMRKQRGFAYYCTLLLSVLFMMTNTLSNAAIRYVYYLQPFLILSSAAAVFFIMNHIFEFTQSIRFRITPWLKSVLTMALFVLVVLGSSHFMKLYRLSNFAHPSGVHTRANVHYIDYRNSGKYVGSYYQDGDLVITIVANALTYYTGLGSQYFMQIYTMRQVLYDPSERSPRYLERIVGNPVIRDFYEFQEVLSSYRRIWLLAVPESIFMRLSGAEVRNYIQRIGAVAYESYNAKVYLIEN